MSYTLEERGSPNTLEYRIFYRDENNKLISPFHDIPWKVGDNFNMVVEVPRWSNAKMEIATKESLNPIKQDVKKGKLRYVANPFPYNGYIWNYGAIPQTWEDPNHRDANTGENGDNDPIDVCEIGSRVCNRGDVIQVKVLGVLAMIDEGETDWKIIAIDVKDPDADKLNCIADVEAIKPGYLDATRNWFKIYKIPDGKPANAFAFDGQYKDRDFAISVVNETHKFWQDFIANKDCKTDLERCNTCCENSPYKCTSEKADDVLSKTSPKGPAVQVTDEKCTKYYFVSNM